jgi:hypothetical protein
MTRGRISAETAHRYHALHEIGCVVCRREQGAWVAPEIHHLKGAPYSGMGKKASDSDTIPLCPAHHRHAPLGFHAMGQKAWEDRYGSQSLLLAATNELAKVTTT